MFDFVTSCTLSSYWRYRRTYDVAVLIKSMMAALVSVTAGSVVLHPWESLLIGLVGAVLGVFGSYFVRHILVLDDPLSVISVHGLCAIWGLLAVGKQALSYRGSSSSSTDRFHLSRFMYQHLPFIAPIKLYVM